MYWDDRNERQNYIPPASVESTRGHDLELIIRERGSSDPGVQWTIRGRPSPISGGCLCLSSSLLGVFLVRA